MGEWRYTSIIQYQIEVSGSLRPVSLYSQKIVLVPIPFEARCTLGPVRTL
jgi:hypothetical protein